jgi:hypothetical protein
VLLVVLATEVVATPEQGKFEGELELMNRWREEEIFLSSCHAISNGIPIWEPNSKMGIQHNTYSLQQSTHTEDPLWVSGEP